MVFRHLHSTSCLSGRVDSVEVDLTRRNKPNILTSPFQIGVKTQNSILSDDIAYCQKSNNVSFTPKTNNVIHLARACFFHIQQIMSQILSLQLKSTTNQFTHSSFNLMKWWSPRRNLILSKSHVYSNLYKEFTLIVSWLRVITNEN